MLRIAFHKLNKASESGHKLLVKLFLKKIFFVNIKKLITIRPFAQNVFSPKLLWVKKHSLVVKLSFLGAFRLNLLHIREEILSRRRRRAGIDPHCLLIKQWTARNKKVMLNSICQSLSVWLAKSYF